MSQPVNEPLIDPSDLSTYLGDPKIDSDRAALMIQLATLACLDVVSPIPASKVWVVYRVAGNAYLSTTSRSYQQSQADAALGNYTRTNGVTLTAEDRADLLGDEEGQSATGTDAFTIRLQSQQCSPWDAWQQRSPWGCW